METIMKMTIMSIITMMTTEIKKGLKVQTPPQLAKRAALWWRRSAKTVTTSIRTKTPFPTAIRASFANVSMEKSFVRQKNASLLLMKTAGRFLWWRERVARLTSVKIKSQQCQKHQLLQRHLKVIQLQQFQPQQWQLWKQQQRMLTKQVLPKWMKLFRKTLS